MVKIRDMFSYYEKGGFGTVDVMVKMADSALAIRVKIYRFKTEYLQNIPPLRRNFVPKFKFKKSNIIFLFLKCEEEKI